VAELVRELLPEKEHKYFNWGLIDLGAIVCTYKGFDSGICPVKYLCDYCEKIKSAT